MEQDYQLGRLLPADYAPSLIIVGNGPVGVQLANQLIELGWQGHIKLFGRSQNRPYKRHQLDAFLQGELNPQQIRNNPKRSTLMRQFNHRAVINIDAQRQQVWDEQGEAHYYDHLVLATGASQHIQSLNPNGLSGVFGLRNLADSRNLLTQLGQRKHIAVLGGDALALQTARVMLSHAEQVTLVQDKPVLLNEQLDEFASRALQSRAHQLGIQFKLNRQLVELGGQERLDALLLTGNQQIHCDALVITNHVTANTELAKAAGLRTKDGICVNDSYQTTAPAIYAIGECAEQNGRLCQSQGHGFYQAQQLARQLVGVTPSETQPSEQEKLELFGLSLTMLGDLSGLQQPGYSSWVFQQDHQYRRLLLKQGRLVGAIVVGEWDELASVERAVQQHDFLFPWHKMHFQWKGNLGLRPAVNLNVQHINSYFDIS